MLVKCDICDFENTDNSKFCSGCGVNLKEPHEESSAISQDQSPPLKVKNPKMVFK
jgi:hypothetical protein